MKIKVLLFILIICSIFSGIIGTYIFLGFLGNNFNYFSGEKSIITNNITNKNISIINLQSEITKLVKGNSESVVSIIIKKDLDLYRSDPFGFFQEKVGSVEKKVGGGSGFFISKDGVILTNKHVVSDKNAKYTVITSSGEEFEASILAEDKLTDLAVLKISNSNKIFKSVEFINDENEINVGQFAIAIGNALAEFQNSVSFGVISGKNRSIQASGENFTENLYGLLQTDAAINPGNSGGPLIGVDGRVLGINTAISGNAQGLGFSIPLTKKRVDYIINSIKKYSEIKRPFIGINYIILTPEISKKIGLNLSYGAYIPDDENSVLPGSSAQNSSIEKKDIILEIQNQKITQQNPLQAIIQNKIPGDEINIKLLKNSGEIKNISLILGEE